MDKIMITKRNIKFSIQYLLLNLILSISFCATADSSPNKDNNNANTAIGLSSGWVVGNGLLLRQHFGRYYAQTTFSGMLNKEKEKEYFDLSVSAGHYFHTMKSNFLVSQIGLKSIIGAEVFHEKKGIDEPDEKTRNEFLAGFGVGVELGKVRRKGLVVSMNVLYTATFSGFKARELTKFGMKPAISAVYNFN